MIDTMEADSFINCIRRFIARRGHPEVLFLDNGTHFVGAYNQMTRAQQEPMQYFMAQQRIQWELIPPKGSHHGGVWERMVKTIKRVINGVVPYSKGTTSSEILSTLLCEVEAQVNNQPLTKVSKDPNDAAALTPSHLLLLNSGNSLIKDVYRTRWRQVQYLADHFWR